MFPCQPQLKKRRFEIYLTPENYQLLEQMATLERRPKSGMVDEILTRLRLRSSTQPQKQKAPDAIHVWRRCILRGILSRKGGPRFDGAGWV